MGHACRPSVVVAQREQHVAVVALKRVCEVLSTCTYIVRLQGDHTRMMISADA